MRLLKFVPGAHLDSGEESATVTVGDVLQLDTDVEARRFRVEKYSTGRWKVVEFLRD